MKSSHGLVKKALAIQTQAGIKGFGGPGLNGSKFSFERQGSIYPYRRGPAFDCHPVKLLKFYGSLTLLNRCFAGHDGSAVKFIEAFQTGGQVDRVADNRVVKTFSRTKVAHHCFAGVQTDAAVQPGPTYFFKMPVKAVQSSLLP